MTKETIEKIILVYFSVSVCIFLLGIIEAVMRLIIGYKPKSENDFGYCFKAGIAMMVIPLLSPIIVPVLLLGLYEELYMWRLKRKLNSFEVEE